MADTFINGNQDILASGRVIDLGEFVKVKYDAPPAEGRAPQVGDLAVKTQ